MPSVAPPHDFARTARRIVALTIGLDQLTKWVVTSQFTLGQSIPIIPSVLHLTYVQNTGAAFGLLKGMTALFILLSVGVAVWIVLELRSRRGLSPTRVWALSLVLGGAVGNLIDRIWHGHVIDFIDLRVWPVFNVADSAITIGVTLLLLPIVLQTRGADERR